MLLQCCKQSQQTQNMLDQRRRRWAGVVQMLYNCFVFAGIRFVKHIKKRKGVTGSEIITTIFSYTVIAVTTLLLFSIHMSATYSKRSLLYAFARKTITVLDLVKIEKGVAGSEIISTIFYCHKQRNSSKFLIET